MQDADVPIWDKGDKTDDYAQGGGGGFSFFGSDGKEDKVPIVEEIYQLVLGRKPTSRELSYYRYATVKKDEIVKKLLNSDEHKDTVKKGRDYPDLEQRERLDQSAILKLKHSIEDNKEEFENMKAMLVEKNSEITLLREEKRIPFVTQSFLEGKGNIYYGENYSISKEKREDKMPDNWLDKIAYIIKKISK